MTQEDLKTYFRYDKNTGRFFRLKKTGRKGKLGEDIYHITDSGYYLVQMFGKKYKAHHLAWLYEYGELPSTQIDHINGNRADNRIDNLRVVSNQENSKNSKKFNNNTSGYTGVSKFKNKWRAYITVNGKQKHLGVFDSILDAVAKRQEANILYGYHINHGRG